MVNGKQVAVLPWELYLMLKLDLALIIVHLTIVRLGLA